MLIPLVKIILIKLLISIFHIQNHSHCPIERENRKMKDGDGRMGDGGDGGHRCDKGIAVGAVSSLLVDKHKCGKLA